MRGRIPYVERRRFLAHFRPYIRKLCMVSTYADMDELLASTIEVEKVLGEIGEISFEPLKDVREDEMNEGETLTEWHIHALNETLINLFKGSNGKELAQPTISNSSSLCQLCNMMGHSAFSCSKLFEKPKCGKCERGHNTENYGLKCSYCFKLGHIEK